MTHTLSDTVSTTHYSLPWGSLEVVTANGVRTLTGTCKACGQVTRQEETPDTNPFQAIRPQHATDCAYMNRLKPPAPPTATVTLPAGRTLEWKIAAAAGAGLAGLGTLLGWLL